MNSDVDFSRDDGEDDKVAIQAASLAQDSTIIKLNAKEKKKYDEYIEKYAGKLYKIYKKLNVKSVSKEVLKKEIDGSKHLLQILDSISGNYNKIANQIQ